MVYYYSTAIYIRTNTIFNKYSGYNNVQPRVMKEKNKQKAKPQYLPRFNYHTKCECNPFDARKPISSWHQHCIDETPTFEILPFEMH